jgi:cytolysin (calcineurin-like family phosphatase)
MTKTLHGLTRMAMVALALCLSVLTLGCPTTPDYGVDDCSRADPPLVEDFWRGPGETDVTFVAFGDSQFGGGAPDKNTLQVQAINAAEAALSWQAGYFGLEEPVSRIRGVIIAGDLTQNGRDGRCGSDNEYGNFVNAYGLCGNRAIQYPVFEGYGNHDYFMWDNLCYRIPEEHPVADSVSVRNAYRAGVLNEAPGSDGHYSWEWDDVHFVMVNLCPSNLAPQREVPGDRNPRNALAFLEQDLAANVSGTDKKVVVISHYGFFSSWDFDGWWTEEEADAYYDVVSGYNLIAHLHGHAHQTSKYTWRGLRIYNLASPYYLSYNPDGMGHFTLFRITNDTLYVGDVAWNPEDPEGGMEFPALWHDVASLG